MKKIISFIMVFVFTIGSFQTLAFAETNNAEEIKNITIEFHNEISDEAREKVLAHFHGEDENVVNARGLTCTLFMACHFTNFLPKSPKTVYSLIAIHGFSTD